MMRVLFKICSQPSISVVGFLLPKNRTNERRAEMSKLLDRPFTTDEKREILDMLQGNINRISVSNDIEEIVCQLNFAVDRLSAVAYSRIKELKRSEGE